MALDLVRQPFPTEFAVLLTQINGVEIGKYALLRIITPMHVHHMIEKHSSMIRSPLDIFPNNLNL